MAQLSSDVISDLLKSTTLNEKGVSFKGKSLKLNNAEDCEDIIAGINSCECMEFLNLEGNTLGVEASEAIAKALEAKPELKRALWKDMFTGRMKEEIPKALCHLGNGLSVAGTKLTELDLSDNAFGPIGVEGLAGLLASSTCYQLQILKLNNNGLGISGGKMLASALLQCHKNSLKNGKGVALKVFIAGRNRLENEGAIALSEVFKTLGSLEEISLPQNGIYPPGIKALCQSFSKNKNLQVINLNDNTITEAGAVAISKTLLTLQNLKILNLGDCLLKTKGASTIAKALTDKHVGLEELHMNHNEIKSSGGLAVVKAMRNKNNLKHLYVNGNQFGGNGCKALKDEMTAMNKLSCLDTLSEDESEGDSDINDKNNSGNENESDGEKSQTSFNSSKLNNSIIQNDSKYSFLQQEQDIESVNAFLNCPTEDNFHGINEKVINNYIQWKQNSTPEFYIDTLIPIIMKISSLTSCPNDNFKNISCSISNDLYKQLFSWANDNDQLSMVNNMLIVYLGLIKNENKDFKLNWNVEGSLNALKQAISKGIAPKSIEQILDCCQKRTIGSCKVEEIKIV